MPPITVALPKGKLLAPSLTLFRRLGYDVDEAENGSRRLIFEEPRGALRFVLVKPDDVPSYVEYGAADLGIVGRDVVEESGRNVYEPLLLGFGRCRLAVAGPEATAAQNLRLRPSVRIATKYPRLAREYFLCQGLSVEIIHLQGSVELAPAVGLADLIVDVVETGRTLRENGLVEIEMVMESEACLIVNRASHKLRLREITALLEKIAGGTAGG